MSTIVARSSNASKWQMGFNSAFKGLMGFNEVCCDGVTVLPSFQQVSAFCVQKFSCGCVCSCVL
jgi:hypothetical protein